jgi:hypothetical protein
MFRILNAVIIKYTPNPERIPPQIIDTANLYPLPIIMYPLKLRKDKK